MARRAAAGRADEPQRDDVLTRERIVAAALDLIEEVGFSGLSMRLLGDRLGVSHMAVYHHVRDKRALQEMVADAVLERVELPGDEAGDWVERLVAHSRSFWAELVRYPGLGSFVINEHHLSDTARRLYEYTITTLLDAGFSPRDAALGREALFALSPYYLAHPSLAARRSRSRRGGSRSKWDSRVDSALEAAAEVDDLERWTFAKRALLEGLRARLAGSGPDTTARRAAR